MLGSKKSTTQTSASLALSARTRAEDALNDLVFAQNKTDEAIDSVEAQIETLLAQKAELTSRSRELDFTINGVTRALFPQEQEIYAGESDTHA